MTIPVPPLPNGPLTDSNGNATQVFDQWSNSLVAVLNNTGGSVLQTNAGGTGQSSYTNGQLLIGNTTGSTLTATTLTAGTNIGITNGPGSITISLNTITGLTTANGGTGQTTYTDGQLLIGDSSNNSLDKATLTPGTGISITNGHGSITINGTSAGTNLSLSGTTLSTTVINPLITNITTQSAGVSGTYIPSTGMVFCIVELWAGGGSGAGAPYGGSANTSAGAGSGGGAGGYSRGIFTAAQIGASKSYTIGAGALQVNANTNGNSGGDSIFGPVGPLLAAIGGKGGLTGSYIPLLSINATTTVGGDGGQGLISPGGITTYGGEIGGASQIIMLNVSSATGIVTGGKGGNSSTGSPCTGAASSDTYKDQNILTSAGFADGAISAYTPKAVGGAGGVQWGNDNKGKGGAGGNGYIYITEFCSV